MSYKELFVTSLILVFISCGAPEKKAELSVANDPEYPEMPEKLDAEIKGDDGFVYKTEEFADIKILRYKVSSWDNLSDQQKKFCYYMNQAALSGRDITYDQFNKHNLSIRRALENIYTNYHGDKDYVLWKNFRVYLKRIWFSSGIHHHYAYKKFSPGFSKEYLKQLAEETGTDISEEIYNVIFDPSIYSKKVNKAKGTDLVAGSANNFYENLSMGEAKEFLAGLSDVDPDRPVLKGLNSKLVKDENGTISEKVWKVGGMYSEAIVQIIYWLEKASTVAESEAQKNGLELLIDFYRTGDLATWDQYNLEWIKDTEGVVDYINGFIEVYDDALGKKATYESVIQIKDFDASARMSTLDQNIQWFEDNSPIMNEHKKAEVTGVTYKVVEVVGEAGATSPSTPIGINLPNSPWIRKKGSKSVSLGNVISAYDEAAGSGMLEEFALTEELVERSKKHGDLAGKLHTALHEVIGHASGQLEPHIKNYADHLENYASTMEEARADLVALYYIVDPKLIELGLIESIEVGYAEYDSYMRNGLQLQLRRLQLGDEIEEDHMRNRQLIAKWVYEKGKADNVVERVIKEDRSYFVVNDYDKLRSLFGELLREIQRIKSQGDFQACSDLVENYGVKVDQEIHAEVLERIAPLQSVPYSGFINPIISGDLDVDGNVSNVKLDYGQSFEEQMLYYSKNYSFLPSVN